MVLYVLQFFWDEMIRRTWRSTAIFKISTQLNICTTADVIVGDADGGKREANRQSPKRKRAGTEGKLGDVRNRFPWKWI